MTMTTTPRTPRSTFDPRRSSQEPQRLVLTRQPNATTPELSIEMNPGDSTRRPKRMGWDLNPRDAFTSAGFQGRRRPSATPSGNNLENKCETLPGPRRRHRWPSTRTKQPSQTETQHAKSRPLTRQVSDKSRLVCLELARNSREWKSPLPSPIHAASGTALARDIQLGLTQLEDELISVLSIPSWN